MKQSSVGEETSPLRSVVFTEVEMIHKLFNITITIERSLKFECHVLVVFNIIEPFTFSVNIFFSVVC